jgi:hypothetical protein
VVEVATEAMPFWRRMFLSVAIRRLFDAPARTPRIVTLV